MRLLDFEDGEFKEYKSCWNFDDVGNSLCEESIHEDPYVEYAPFIEFDQIERNQLAKNNFQFKVNFSFKRDCSKWYVGPIIEPVEKLYWIYNSFNDLLAKVMISPKDGGKIYLINKDNSNDNERFYNHAKEMQVFKEVVNELICENKEILKYRSEETFSFRIKLSNGEERIKEVYLKDSEAFYYKSNFSRFYNNNICLFRNTNSELILIDLDYFMRFKILLEYIFSIDPAIIQIESNEKINCPLIKTRIDAFKIRREGEFEVRWADGKIESVDRFIKILLSELVRNGLIRFQSIKYFKGLANVHLKASGINFSDYKTVRLKQIKLQIEETDQYIKQYHEKYENTDLFDPDMIKSLYGQKKSKLFEETYNVESAVDFP